MSVKKLWLVRMCTLSMSENATYVVNIEWSNSKFPLFLLDQTTFYFALLAFYWWLYF